jgi:hypothetical protein
MRFMDCQLICQWLGLPATAWPPDYYVLLGLPPGEGDTARIEQHAHERLARLRCYQITHPEQATEAMNRLAQAMVCLTDPDSKRRYDAGLGLRGNGKHQATPQEQQAPGAAAALDWAKTPPPVRVPTASEAAQAAVAPPAMPAPVPPPVAPLVGAAPLLLAAPSDASGVLPPIVLSALPADPVLEAARSSPEARRGLGTRRALLERLLVTRELMRLWDQVGRYLARPKRRLAKPAEDGDLTRRLTRMDRQLLDFPRLLGQAGQPGYRVVMLAREEHVAEAFKALGPDERETLALDWKIARGVLAAHLQFVRKKVKTLRRLKWWKRLLRPGRVWVNDHPGWALAAVLFAFLFIALSSYYWR